MERIEHRNVKPCPFCGGKVVYTTSVDGYKRGAAVCKNCGAIAPYVITANDEGDYAAWREYAIDEWNTRKSDDV